MPKNIEGWVTHEDPSRRGARGLLDIEQIIAVHVTKLRTKHFHTFLSFNFLEPKFAQELVGGIFRARDPVPREILQLGLKV